MAGVFGGILALASVALFLFGAVSVVRPFRSTPINSRGRAAGVVLGSVVLLLVAGALLPSVPAEPATQRALQPQAAVSSTSAKAPPAPDELARLLDQVGRVRHITHVALQGRTLAVSAAIEPLDAQLYLTDSADLVAALGKVLRKEPASAAHPINDVQLLVSGPAQDRLGRSTSQPFIQLIFPADDLRQAEFDNLSYAGTLDLASDIGLQNGAGLDAVRAFCGGNLGASSRTFCPFLQSQQLSR